MLVHLKQQQDLVGGTDLVLQQGCRDSRAPRLKGGTRNVGKRVHVRVRKLAQNDLAKPRILLAMWLVPCGGHLGARPVVQHRVGPNANVPAHVDGRRVHVPRRKAVEQKRRLVRRVHVRHADVLCTHRVEHTQRARDMEQVRRIVAVHKRLAKQRGLRQSPTLPTRTCISKRCSSMSHAAAAASMHVSTAAPKSALIACTASYARG